MKNILVLLLILFTAIQTSNAQTEVTSDDAKESSTTIKKALPKGRFYTKEGNFKLYLDLNEESIVVPGYELIGKVHGYTKAMRDQGNWKSIYNDWFVTTVTQEDEKNFVIEMSREWGDEVQTFRFTDIGQGQFQYKCIGKNQFKKGAYADEKKKKTKWVYLPKEMIFIQETNKL